MDKTKILKNLNPGYILLVNSFAGPKVYVKVTRVIFKEKEAWGADGCEGVLIYEEDVKSLISSGVPYKDLKNQNVWVFDFQIIKKIRKKKIDNLKSKKGRRRIVRK